MSIQEPSQDVDHGWAFVVLFGNLLAFFLLMGIPYSSGIFYTTFLNEFEESPSLTAWATNMQLFCTYAFSELANIVSKKVGPRATMMFGGCLSSIGLISTSFAYNIYWIFFFNCAFIGLGYSFMFLPTYHFTALYFQRYRRLGFSFMSAGGSVGQFIHPMIFAALTEKYHWRSAFLIIGAINLNSLVVAAVMMQPRHGMEECHNESVNEELVTDIETVEEGSECKMTESRCKQFGKAIASYLALFHNLRYSCLIIGTTLISVGVSAFYIHVPNFVIVSGYDFSESTLIASSIGLGGLVTRLLLAVIVISPKVHTPTLFSLSLTLAGAACTVFGMFHDFHVLLMLATLFGILMAAWGLIPELVIVSVGLNKLRTGMSFVNIFGSAGLLIGGPFAALLYEMDPTYFWSFLIVGSICLVGGFFHLPFYIDRIEKCALYLLCRKSGTPKKSNSFISND